MRPLTLINTLEYYDVPQILVAADATGTNYLCTLYKNDAEDGFLYLGVQISEPRLMAFLGGQLDLRDAYVHPEVENALYVVTARNEVLTATILLQPQGLTEDMLPEAGYFYDSSDLTDEAETQTVFKKCIKRKNSGFIASKFNFGSPKLRIEKRKSVFRFFLPLKRKIFRFLFA